MIQSPIAPPSKNPLTHAIKVENFLFISGQTGKMNTGELPATLEDEFRQAMENIKSIVETAGGNMNQIVKTL